MTDCQMRKKEVARQHLAPLIRACKNDGWGADYMLGEEIIERFHPRHETIYPHSEYIVATAENGYHYYIDVSADSPLTMIYEAVKLLQYK